MPLPDISCGLEYSVTPDLQTCLTEALQSNYSFIVSPIVHPRFNRHRCSDADGNGSFTRSDMVLAPNDWTSRIVGRLSPHLNVDAISPVARQRHEDCLNEELAYCKGLGLPAIMLKLHGKDSSNLARILLSYYENSYQQSLIWVQVPMVSRRSLRTPSPESDEEEDPAWNETWYWWSKFHEQLEWDKRVGVVVELPADMPPPAVVTRWLGEPVKAVLIPTSLFHCNKKGFPVLSREHQALVSSLVEREAQVVVTGARRHALPYYLEYLRRLWARRRSQPDDPMLHYARGWEDYLQVPLQPLADNLDTHTYDVFEKDPIKYDQYQKAIIQALVHVKTKIQNEKNKKHTAQEQGQGENKNIIANIMNNIDHSQGQTGDQKVDPGQVTGSQGEKTGDKDQKTGDQDQNTGKQGQIIGDQGQIMGDQGQNNGDQVNDNEEPITVMVLGAGRGPLVRATLNAADVTNTKVKVIAVEKNPTAMVVLAAQARSVWRARDVSVLRGDMRRLPAHPRAHIAVSELLGSWGDNELSPECLDGAARLLMPGGVSIPSSYTSYAAPVSSPRLWAAARVASTAAHHTRDKNLETLWVVYMQNKHDIAETKPVFTFEHPARGAPDHLGQESCDWRGLPLPDNRRCATLTWQVQQDNVMHGFGGYFECTLFGSELISIVPSTHSPGMISWFPVFIPIKTPLRVRRGEVITATFWRCVDSRRVWYEWVAQVGERTTPIHNVNGRSSEMLLYFECTLFGSELISIVPSTHSPGMISWFPVFIPIKTPLRVRRGEVITATFWRCVDSRRVWYEWVAQVGERTTPIHNVNGRSSEMLL